MSITSIETNTSISDEFHRLLKDDYLSVKEAIHIGFLDYDLFPEHPEFYANYQILNTKNFHKYTDNFALRVLSLNQTNLATEEDKLWKIDLWAKLFKAQTWEEIKMLTQNDTSFQAASTTLYKLNADELVRQQCQAREDFMRLENTRTRKIQMLEDELESQKLEAQKELESQEQKYLQEIASLKEQLSHYQKLD